jgi:C-terminal processing protease CtpA/Prc
MRNRLVLIAVGVSALGLVLVALPTRSATQEGSEHDSVAKLQQKVKELQARLQHENLDQKVQAELEARDQALRGVESALAYQNVATETEAQALALRGMEAALAGQEIALQGVEKLPEVNEGMFSVLMDEDDASWLGVETHDVTSAQAKERKLSAERGVFVGKVVPDSPAAKAGLKENDIITEINGQRVEGAVQFRRMIHEIPAGRAVQLGVWRDARAQNISVTLGKAEQHQRIMMQKSMPGTFAFRTPEMPDMPEVPEMNNFEFFINEGHPRLGIDAEDLNGQLGSFFGAPEGEAILVREVNPGTPAEKAGLKAGDVITSINGQRIRSVGELREKIAEQKDEHTVKLGVVRNKAELSLTVELPAPAQKQQHKISRRTNI